MSKSIDITNTEHYLLYHILIREIEKREFVLEHLNHKTKIQDEIYPIIKDTRICGDNSLQTRYRKEISLMRNILLKLADIQSYDQLNWSGEWSDKIYKLLDSIDCDINDSNYELSSAMDAGSPFIHKPSLFRV